MLLIFRGRGIWPITGRGRKDESYESTGEWHNVTKYDGWGRNGEGNPCTANSSSDSPVQGAFGTWPSGARRFVEWLEWCFRKLAAIRAITEASFFRIGCDSAVRVRAPVSPG
jgi:hypothetical protein